MAAVLAAVAGKQAGRFELVEGQPVVIGRAEDAHVRIEADPHLSRRHVELILKDGVLRVTRLSGSANPVYFDGSPRDQFALRQGQTFVIGATSFTFQDDEPADREPATESKTIASRDLYELGSSTDRMRLLDLLELPEILRQRQRVGFLDHIAKLLCSSTRAFWACALSEDGRVLGQSPAANYGLLHQPSRTLIRKAVEDAPQPTIYWWNRASGAAEATAQEGFDWAVCAAARVTGEPALVFYAAGAALAGWRAGRDEARFVGLVADMVGRALSTDRLAAWERRLERFFSQPVVSKILRSPDLSSLEPHVAESTVLFFDIRGFSRRSEQDNGDILGTIEELRRVMTAMTQIILEESGVVLQYLGDGIMACWNVPFADASHVDRACRAALRMAETIGRTTKGWSCGIGLHTGEVVAGAIGSEQVFSYGLLGPSVNMASRIEGLTKAAGAPVLASAAVVAKLSPGGPARRRIGRFRPSGMASDIELYALTPEPPPPELARIFAEGLAAFEAGRWKQAQAILAGLPHDGPSAFLAALARRHEKAPPADWRGTIGMEHK